jgi:hypothetical protein
MLKIGGAWATHSAGKKQISPVPKKRRPANLPQWFAILIAFCSVCRDGISFKWMGPFAHPEDRARFAGKSGKLF